jgi:hypothetical protein
VGACEVGELRVVGDELVQAALDVESGGDRSRQKVAPRRRETSALRRDPDDGNGRFVRERVLDRSDDRDPVVVLPCSPRVEDGDDLIGDRSE